jgi:chromosomal replication initiation ATPase DnaA
VVSEEERELWRGVLVNLKAHVPTATFDTFVEPTLLLSVEDGTGTILAGNPHAKDWLQNRFLKAFKDELNISLRTAGKQPLSSIKIEVISEYKTE